MNTSVKSLFFLFGLMICLISCENKGNNDAPVKEKSSSPAISEKAGTASSGNSEKDRAAALAIIEHRKTEEPEAYQIIDADLWHYEFVFSGREMSKPGEYDGHWIDFSPEFTYNFGYYSETKGSGKYHFSNKSSTLIMLDDQEDIGPLEWQIKHAGNVMILVGRSTYGKNSQQIKLVRNSDYPTK